MPPHGRRRLTCSTFFLLWVFLFTSVASAASSVLGIDLGTEYIKAALVKPGIPLEIVLTKDSKRKETAAVAFKPLPNQVDTEKSNSFPERLYGGDAVALSARYPSDVYLNLKPLLRLKLSDELTSEYGAVHSGKRLVEKDKRGTVGFKSEAFVPEEEAWSVEELLAMELKNVKDNAEAMAGKNSEITDAVITIPSFYTVEERRAVTLAADLAGLRILSLITDGLAVGLNYATSRTFPTVNDGAKPEIHLVYDMGAGSTTATVLKFQGRVIKDIGKFNKTVQEVQVLGTGWDKSLGGEALNKLVLDDMIETIVSTSQMKALKVDTQQIRSHGRTMAKLWKESERMRQVLSANSETSTTIEGLYNEDFMFKYKISRTRFENLASGYTVRVSNPIEDALMSAKLSYDDLESVILHGGAVRTPFVQKQLEGIISGSEKIRTNVNADEAAVFGAAFRAAAVNPSFRVKDIRAVDGASYPVSVSWSTDGKTKQQRLFVPTSFVGAEKQLALKVTEDLTFSMYQQVSNNDVRVAVAKTQNLTSSIRNLIDLGCTVKNITSKFSFRLSPVDGSPELVKSTASCEIMEPESKRGGVMEGLKDVFGLGSKRGDQEPLKEDAEIEASNFVSESISSTTADSVETSANDKLASSSAKEEKVKETKRKTHILNIALSAESIEEPFGSPWNIDWMKKRLAAFDRSDRSRVRREETLNRLEGYTYKVRDMLQDQGLIAVSTAEQRSEIETKSNDASEWLYGDGAYASREVLQERLNELQNLMHPIQQRKDEAKKRPEEIQKLKDTLQQAETLVDMIKAQMKAQSLTTDSTATPTVKFADTQITTSPTERKDEFDDLEVDSSTSSVSTTTQSNIPPPPTFSETEVTAIEDRREATRKWLEEKIVAQEKLSASDDPILLSEDLSVKSRDLNKVVMDLLQKQMKEAARTSKKVKTSKTKKETSSSSSLPVAASSESSHDRAGEQPQQSKGSTVEMDDILEDLEAQGLHRVKVEDLQEAAEEHKSKSGKPRKSEKAKARATGKGKNKVKSTTTGKEKAKGKLKDQGWPEREL